jgi:hypothetical protein
MQTHILSTLQGRMQSKSVYSLRGSALRWWIGGSDGSVSKAGDRFRRMRTEERESALAVRRASEKISLS